jgi:hypothetical protein
VLTQHTDASTKAEKITVTITHNPIMSVRKTARWQWGLDDRILEHLNDESYSTASIIANLEGIHATENQVQERCEILAEAELVAFITEDQDLIELTTWGKQYLEGDMDVENHPTPAQVRNRVIL